jgi:hypothetical protein
MFLAKQDLSMIESTVNIADFRCRAVKIHAIHSPERTSRQNGPALVESRGNAEIVSMSGASRGSRVYDIGIARDAQRMRPRVVFRPISIQRRAKVLRFHEASEALPRATAIMTASPRWNPAVDGPYDLPPAA